MQSVPKQLVKELTSEDSSGLDRRLGARDRIEASESEPKCRISASLSSGKSQEGSVRKDLFRPSPSLCKPLQEWDRPTR